MVTEDLCREVQERKSAKTGDGVSEQGTERGQGDCLDHLMLHIANHPIKWHKTTIGSGHRF